MGSKPKRSAMTVNRFCSSDLRSIAMAAERIPHTCDPISEKPHSDNPTSQDLAIIQE
jgi:hypothetical protein